MVFSKEKENRWWLYADSQYWKTEFCFFAGTWSVIFLTFADVKQTNFRDAASQIKNNIADLYAQHRYLLDELEEEEWLQFRKVLMDMDDVIAANAIRNLMDYLSRYYRKNVIVLLDEYDTPLQEAYVNGYWKEMEAFTREIFNATFKTNPYLERAIMTGITRVSKESIFSDLNHLDVVTTTSDKYATAFGFTEEEVFAALDEAGIPEEKEKDKEVRNPMAMWFPPLF